MKKKNNVVNFDEAERKAKARDFDLENIKYAVDHGGLSQEAIQYALNMLNKATGEKVFIGTKRSPKSKVRFAQLLQENLGFLNKQKYLTGREKIFLQDIIPYIAFESNCIVLDIKAKSPVPANISEIGELIKSPRQNVSAVVNSLKKKGIIAKAESGVEGSNAKAYAIFINPHVIYAGDKDSVNESLKAMFNKAMKMAVLKTLPDKLF